jgi:hypothetical protein
VGGDDQLVTNRRGVVTVADEWSPGVHLRTNRRLRCAFVIDWLLVGRWVAGDLDSVPNPRWQTRFSTKSMWGMDFAPNLER